ncbi:MAG: hypothetical protein PSV35_10585, partial [bacterium]|nr:hypothetical protein [bacterium]
MNLASWFKIQEKKLHKLVTLEEVLLSGRFRAYGIFRLKYFNAQLVLNYVTHLIFLTFLFNNLSHRHAVVINILLALSVMLQGAWWGGLEVLRDSVRMQYKHRKRKAMGESIGAWLVMSVLLSVLLLIVMMVFCGYSVFYLNYSALYLVSIMCIICTLALQLPVRTYHSAMYALSRISRSTSSIFFADFIFIFFFTFSYKFLGLYTLPLVYLLKSIVAQLISIHYINKAYKWRNIEIRCPNLKYVPIFIKEFPVRKWMMASLTMATLTLDHLLLALGLLYAKQNISTENFTFLILILPLLYASVDWSKNFYFDYKKDLKNDFKLFFQHFENKVIFIAFFSGFFFWLLACITHFIFMPSNPMTLCLWLLPIFILRAKISLLQIKHFSESNYKEVICSNILFYCGVISLFFVAVSMMLKMGILLVMCFILMKYMSYIPKNTKKINPIFKTPLHFYAWLEALRTYLEKHHVEVHLFSLSKEIKTHALNRLIQDMYQLCTPHNSELCIYQNTMIIFNSPMVLNKSDLWSMSRGWIYQHRQLDLTSIDQISIELIPQLETKKIESKLSCQPEQIKEHFFNYFPKGICFDPRSQLDKSLKRLSYQMMNKVLNAAKHYLDGKEKPLLLGYYISVLYYSGSAQMIFLIPAKNMN